MARFTIDTTPGQIDFECGGTYKRILQNVKNLLMLRMGELPYDRMRGLNQRIFDIGIKEANENILPEIDRVLGWEPRAAAMSAQVRTDANGVTVISVDIEI